jgi:hypothetical protein
MGECGIELHSGDNIGPTEKTIIDLLFKIAICSCYESAIGGNSFVAPSGVNSDVSRMRRSFA